MMMLRPHSTHKVIFRSLMRTTTASQKMLGVRLFSSAEKSVMDKAFDETFDTLDKAWQSSRNEHEFEIEAK